MEIVIQKPYQSVQSVKTISIEQYQKKRVQRRRRVAKRQLKRFPLFAVEFMSVEFPNYDYDTFVADVTRKTRKSKSFRSIKNPSFRMGRYDEMIRCLGVYEKTKEVDYLLKANNLKKNMFKPYTILYRLNGRPVLEQNFPPETPYNEIVKFSKFKFTDEQDLIRQLDEIFKNLN